ncbi:ABC transporter permease [Acidovorax lacteus]|uniref:ABC transporter permease n=1 Tax=Acidovorax lacteus TaxID=1924988 RepID=A0ABP8LH05_9BURK
MWGLLRTFSWHTLCHHPWRSLAAVVSVMLGVALAFAVHLINASALEEFSQAVRTVNGEPDLEVRASQGTLPEALYATLATHPLVARASPVLELAVVAAPPAPSDTGKPGVPMRLLGVDALQVGALAPGLAPRVRSGGDRLAILAPGAVFLNPAAQQALGLPADADTATPLVLASGLGRSSVQVEGRVQAPGAPLAVMDLGALQHAWDRAGQLSRIDLQLRPGTDRVAARVALQALPGWPAQAVLAEPGDAGQRISNLSRAYRVNLTVLALVALFTGAYLVFSVLSLGVTQRAPQLALLAVLGATPRQRLGLVLAESAALGLAGSAAGLALGTGLALAALRLLGGDLGGGYFAGVEPPLRWAPAAAALYGLLGLGAALVGGWWPARAAQRLAPAATLKGLGVVQAGGGLRWGGACLLVMGLVLTASPPVAGMALGAYVAIGLLLVGGIALLPVLIQAALQGVAPHLSRHPLAMLAVERARRMHGTAAVAVGGVVASLSLAVALTVMVTSFRGSVTQWLDVVLPSPLYARSALAAGGGGDAALLPAALADAVARLPEVERVHPLRASSVQLDAARPPLTLLSRPFGAASGGDAARLLPLVGNPLPVPPGRIAVYVSEAVVDLYGVRPGQDWPALSKAFGPEAQQNQAQPAHFFIAGVWRDYARQAGAVALDRADHLRLTGDSRISDLALWPRDGADLAALRDAIEAEARSLAQASGGAAPPGPLIEFASATAIRERSLQIFDRSFAVTYWLQAVAIAIGLFGVAASFSAQVLARRKEFGLLAHLGLTRRQILAVVAGEGLAWTALGALAGTGLGLAVSVVLVHVVNPQSFHWTMDLALPTLRLLALAAAVVLAGTVTAWLAGRAAAGREAVLAVKEDW